MQTQTMTRIYHHSRANVENTDIAAMARAMNDIQIMAFNAVEAAREHERLGCLPQPEMEQAPLPPLPIATRGRRRGVVAARAPRTQGRADR